MSTTSATQGRRSFRPPMPRAEDPLGAARALAGIIREAAPAIERERRVPLDIIDALRDAGLFHMLIPRSLGGAEVDPVLACQVVEEIAAADASTGWVVMLAMQSNGFAGLMDEFHALEVWGNGGIVAGTARPIGRAVAVEAPEPGYYVSGRWPFASGSSHADWFIAECVVYDGDEPRRDAEGQQVTRMLFVPREDAVIHDTWNATGLRGTASHDFTVEGAFVPVGRGFQIMVTQPVIDHPLYRTEPIAFVNHGSHALGVARAALEAAREVIGQRRGWGDAPLREVPRMQSVVAEATAEIEAARAFLYGAARELWDAALAGTPTTLQRSRARLAAAHAMTASLRTVDLLHRTLGTSAIMGGSTLDRCFRDLHTAASHVMIGPLVYEAAGRVELGMEAAFPLF